MQLEDLKTWHWVIIGLLAGVLFSCVRAWQGPAFVNFAADTVDVGEFEHNAYGGTKFGGGGAEGRLINEYHKDLPLLKDVVVHLPLRDDAQHHYWVTGKQYWIGSRFVDAGKVGSAQHMMEGWKPFKYSAATPYVPGFALQKQRLEQQLQERQKAMAQPGGNKIRQMAEVGRLNVEIRQFTDIEAALGGQESFPTVLDYLKAIKVIPGSKLTYAFAWYELPAAVYTLPPLAGFLIIGCAWPLTLSVMQNWGMARPATVAKKPKRRAAAPTPKPTKPIPSTAGVVFKPASPAPVAAAESERNEYRGEFYPVVKASEKK